MEYGIDMLAAASTVVLCENALKVQHLDDDFMVQLAISAFKTGKYSDLVLSLIHIYPAGQQGFHPVSA